MTRIAHLSDLHLDGSVDKRVRLKRALQSAYQASPHHLVITGDLTANGRDSELDEIAEALTRWAPHAVTLVPGNHDAEAGPWRDAILRTNLWPFARTSVPGSVTDLGDVVLVAIDSRAGRRAPIFRAVGRVSDDQLERAKQVIAQNPDRAVVLVMHHGPQWHPLQPWDGLMNAADVSQLLAASPNVSILCGHDHRCLDALGGRVHCAPSVAECAQPLRMYEIVGTKLVPTLMADRGSYLLGLG